MAVTLTDLAIRTLDNMGVLGVDQIASAEDKKKAIAKLKVAHQFLKTERLLRWTLNDIPDYAEEPYVMIASHFAASDFEIQRDPTWLISGLTMIQRAVNLQSQSTTPAEYF